MLPVVPLTPESAKPALLDDMQRAREAQAAYACVAALALPGMLGWPIVAGCAVILVFVLERDRADKERILNDPARPDFRVPVRAKRRRYQPRLRPTSIELATDEFVQRLLMVVAYEEAFLRADERAQGAEAAGEVVMAGERRQEAYRAAARAAEAADDLYVAADALAGEWADGAAGQQLRAVMADPRAQKQLEDIAGPIDVEGAASRQAWNRLERTQLVTYDLQPRPVITTDERAVLRTDLPRELAQRTTSAAAATREATYRIFRGRADGGDDDDGGPSRYVFL